MSLKSLIGMEVIGQHGSPLGVITDLFVEQIKYSSDEPG